MFISMGDTTRITGINEKIKGKTEIRSGTGELFVKEGDKLYLVGKSFDGLKITYNQQPLDCME